MPAIFSNSSRSPRCGETNLAELLAGRLRFQNSTMAAISLFGFLTMRACQRSPATSFRQYPHKGNSVATFPLLRKRASKIPSPEQCFRTSKFPRRASIRRLKRSSATCPWLPGSAGPGINLVTPTSNVSNFDQFTIKFDQRIGTNNRAFVRYATNQTATLNPGLVKELTTSAPASDKNAVAGLNQVIPPNLINEFRASFSRHTLHQGPIENSTNFAKELGLKNTMSTDPAFNALPTVGITGYSSTGRAAMGREAGFLSLAGTASVEYESGGETANDQFGSAWANEHGSS